MRIDALNKASIPLIPSHEKTAKKTLTEHDNQQYLYQNQIVIFDS